jgi:divalent metal cation (Fe/Co/Zn/Cd) transporter
MQIAGYLKLSVAVAVGTIGLKTPAWCLTGSVGLLADALGSLINLAGAGLLMVTVAAQPPDASHFDGHHEAEYFSGGFEGSRTYGNETQSCPWS